MSADFRSLDIGQHTSISIRAWTHPCVNINDLAQRLWPWLGWTVTVASVRESAVCCLTYSYITRIPAHTYSYEVLLGAGSWIPNNNTYTTVRQLNTTTMIHHHQHLYEYHHQCGTRGECLMNSYTRTYMYSYVCEIFALFATFLFARALFGKTLSTPTREARPDTLVEVWARSELCGSRGGRSKFFFPREWISRFPGLSAWGRVSYVRASK